MAIMQWNQRLISSIGSWPSAKVLCIGDVMLDRFIYGNARRISPEAPIPVLLVDREEVMLGGAGNVVRNLAALSAQVFFVSVTGDDADGSLVESLVNGLQGCSARMLRDPDRRTSVKTRYLAQSQQLLRVDAENTAELNEDTFEQLLKHVREVLHKIDLVILSDYAKGVLAGTHALQIIEECRAADKLVFVDPKGADFTRYRGAALIKPNLKELGEAARMDVRDDASLEAAARSIIAHTGIGAVLATRGAAGMVLVREGMPAESFQSMAREIYDVSGAGDTVAATLAVGVAGGMELPEAVRVACAAAGIVVGKIGTATVTRDELVREIESMRRGVADVRLFSEADALQRVQAWRSAGLRIGFVSGTFHPLGASHVAEFGAAREQCDKLVVGVAGRIGEEGHVVLASLATVDLVVVLDGDPAAFRAAIERYQI